MHRASDILLLRIRARDVRYRYQRLNRIIRRGSVDRRKWVSPEVDGDCALARKCVLVRYIDEHLALIKSMMNQIHISREESFRLEQADRGRGALIGHVNAINSAVRQEISKRCVDSWPSVMPNLPINARINSANGQGAASAEAQVTLYPAVFADQLNQEKRFEKEKELGNKSPTATELRTYHRAKAYYERNYDSILRMDKAEERLAVVRSAKRRSEKACKKTSSAILRMWIAPRILVRIMRLTVQFHPSCFEESNSLDPFASSCVQFD